MPWNSGLAGFGLEREDYIARVLGPTVPDPVIALIGVITEEVAIALILYRIAIAYLFFFYSLLKVSFVDRCCCLLSFQRPIPCSKGDAAHHLPPQFAKNILGMLSRVVLKNYKLRED